MAEIIRWHSEPPRVAKESADSEDDFSSIYNQYHLSIYRYILARIGYVEDAQDMTAQVFLKAYQNLASYRRESSIIYWLLGITRHQIIDYYRSSRTHPTLNASAEVASPSSSLEDSLEQKNRLQRVSEVLNTLSEDRREAIMLRLFSGLSNQEIAEIMGKSADAVAMLVYRAIQDLKSRLGGETL